MYINDVKEYLAIKWFSIDTKDMETHTSALIERIARIVHNGSFSGSLKPVQWEILRFLNRANDFSRNPGSVTNYLGLTKGTVSQSLIAIEEKGLIVKEKNTSDKRSVFLNLTADGMRKLSEDPIRDIEKSIELLSEKERDAVSRALEKLVGIMLKKRNNRAFSTCNRCRYFARNREVGNPHFCNLLKVRLSEEDVVMICAEQTGFE